MSVDVAFATLARTSPEPWTRRSAEGVSTHVRAGRSLGEALRSVGAPTPTVAMIIGGEQVGRLADALRSAAELEGHLEGLRSTVRRSLLYPGVVLGIGLAMVVVIAVLVVPSLEQTFVQLGGELPFATRMVLAGSAALRSGPAVLLGIGLALAHPLLRTSVRRLGGNGVGRRLPVLGPFLRDVDMAVATRIITTMLGAGAAFVDALATAGAALPIGPQRAGVETAREAVAQGVSAFGPDGLGGVLDVADVEILAVGERTGLLAEQWGHVADRRDEALRSRVDRVGTLMEPLLVVAVGFLIGGAVLALYLPTFRVLDLL